MRGRLGVAMVWGAVAGCLAGCAGDRPPDECGRGPGQVEVGQGGSRLRDLPASGGELSIVLGAQGGIHVLVGFRVREMDLNMDVVYRLVDPATEEAVGTPTALSLRPALFTRNATGALRNPDLIILDNEAPRVADFAGRAVRLELEAVNDGSRACDARQVVLAAPPE